jgi:antitoxin MazE
METGFIHTKIVKIGNSQGVRIPKSILEMSNIEHEAEMCVDNGAIIIRSPKKVREGWQEAFSTMHAVKDDTLLDADIPTEWDENEWEWS